MKILVVSWKYHPLHSPRVFRWKAIAEKWASQGHEVEVLCERHPGSPAEEVHEGVTIRRVGFALLPAIRSKLTSSADKAPSSGARKPGLLRFLYHALWRGVYWPDLACLWYLSAVPAAKLLLRAGRYDRMVTVSDPFTSHLIGLTLKREFPSVHWSADVGDPFSLSTLTPRNNHRLYGRLNAWLERSVFSAAESVAFTTRFTLERYSELYPEAAPRFRVIPPLISPTPAAARRLFPENGRLRLVFTGTMSMRLLNPLPLLELFAGLLTGRHGPRLELHIFGQWHDCQPLLEPYKGLLGDRIVVHGLVGHDTARAALAQADFLVNIGSDEEPLRLSSKLVEYSNTGKPIINIVTRKDDTSLDFLQGYPSVSLLRTADIPLERSAAEVETFIDAPPRFDSAALQRWNERFRIDTVAAAYLS